MLRSSALLLPVSLLLGGCHLFASGQIEETCTDLGTCADTEIEAAMGLVVSWTVDDASDTGDGAGEWGVVALDPPDWGPTVSKAGAGGLGGPAAYGDGTVYVVDTVSGSNANGWWMYSFDEEGGVETFLLDLETEPVELEFSGDTLYVATTTTVAEIDWLGGGLDTIVSDDGYEFDSLFADGTGGVYFIELSGPDLWQAHGEQGQVAIESYDVSATRSDGGAFLGPDGSTFVCSSSGAVYALDSLVAGDVSPHAYSASAVPDRNMVTCNWDSSLEQFMFLLESAELVGLSETNEVTNYEPLDEGMIVHGGRLY
ncbi:MAG: hypothetical protein QGG40_13180 [Myxococcota bacterium]|nr:hypothetical protein [Myxococcota bacterium]